MHRRTSCKPANETVRSSRACRPRVRRARRATAARRGGAQLTSVRASTKRGRRRSLRGQPARRINRGDGGDQTVISACGLPPLRPATAPRRAGAKPWVSCCGLMPGVGQHEQDQPRPTMGAVHGPAADQPHARESDQPHAPCPATRAAARAWARARMGARCAWAAWAAGGGPTAQPTALMSSSTQRGGLMPGDGQGITGRRGLTWVNTSRE